ncbi:hypothetical protein [Lysinibacillus sp. BW-2-10]|uniref:hypothetical protein n=1 Tax=Lysinibacillus sp. BW-2-10 TaxID=2590030 RepID=UPI00117D7D0F|nr:hypothetical protein [Lysinibacillus sp. BW-2-10]TSI08698.1 hypothetical protein FJQ64_07045 [Lysinibacillus sp. BW-2-10]
MDYKAAYETFLQLAFEEHVYPAAPVVYKLSENQTLTKEYVAKLLAQVETRIFELQIIPTKSKEQEYQKELELFKLNYLLDCLKSPQVAELVNFGNRPIEFSYDVNNNPTCYLEKNNDFYMDILDHANYHMHTIRIILQELWVSKEVDFVI